MNSLICECMFRGKVKALSNMLAQLPLQTLHIARPANERAWQTLLEAMPASCSVSQLILSKQKFDWTNTSLLFDLMGRMPDLKSPHFDSCAFTFWTLRDPPSCPPLLELRNLHVKNTDDPFNLLSALLDASPKLSEFHLDSNADIDIDDEKHRYLATKLSDSHASTLQKLTLRALRDEKCVAQYIDLLKKAKALTHLDLSGNPLGPDTCKDLWKALQDKSTLTNLSLAGCWRSMSDTSDWKDLARLVKLPSLVSLDLSRNKFPSSMGPVLMAMRGHPSLQHLNLSGFSMTNALITFGLPAILENNKTLVSLQLPPLDDSDFAPLVEAMKQNQMLRSLPIPEIERWCSTTSAEESHQLYPNYLALMGQISLNRRAWEEERFALMEGGMKVVLGGLGRTDPGNVFQEIARYAAGHVAIEGDGNQAMTLSLLNKKANEEGQAALKRLQEEK
ncbi:hypothetical protein [Variovorax sp. DT-64]|uniref:hypothetical protein n=1 Tax=Variovorax sp. DT-64 TaxID=3396160 RepID=UPI003F540EF1